ncbi:MAG: M28 family peptidase [Planctomycetes bacterium]|nr:M28 family peptidase [Planctomycetota bacterium]
MSRGLRPPAALLALLLTGCGGCDAQAPTEAPAVAPAGSGASPAGDSHGLPGLRAAPVSEDRLRAWLMALPPHRAIGTEAHARTRAWLLEALRSFGLQPVVRPFEWAGFPQGGLANVEVVLPGRSPDAPWLALSAHYDSVLQSPGADDNGSGVAVLLELARRLSAGGFGRELRLLFFDAEEPGLIGSGAWLLQRDEADLRRCAGLINLETMGFTDRRPGTQIMPAGTEVIFRPGDRGDFLLCLGNFASRALAEAVGDALALQAGESFRVETFGLLPGAGWVLPDTRRSDHAHFWDRGLPAVLLTDTANLRSPHYHTSSDRLETLDLPFLAAATRGVETAARRLLDED